MILPPVPMPDTALPVSLGAKGAAIIKDIVNGYVAVVQSNNQTKIALAEIDARLQQALAVIHAKSKKDILVIENFSAYLDKILDKTDLTASQKLQFVKMFTDAIIRVVES